MTSRALLRVIRFGEQVVTFRLSYRYEGEWAFAGALTVTRKWADESPLKGLNDGEAVEVELSTLTT